MLADLAGIEIMPGRTYGVWPHPPPNVPDGFPASISLVFLAATVPPVNIKNNKFLKAA
ncbi:hypothetical protein [Sphingomonas abietis]|uniref:Uncharacterized protein n=1 Tax=Sphingomonas abietis TaxID=3012344 RepID=A0ABY7NID7_9SPHN|nr:hypothetical protein [Sphingomonas abietis]WBO21279.1 hypothetical protein PBT88_13905 [Sphingomonas abietis]